MGSNRRLGIVWSEGEIPCGWYQWVPDALVEREVRSAGDWFAEQALTAIRHGAKAVWIWHL